MLTEQEKINKTAIADIVEKRPDLQKALKGPVKWVGKVGFDECVAHLSGKKGITDANALCGYLKDQARQTGVLKKKHMGKLERKKAKHKAILEKARKLGAKDKKKRKIWYHSLTRPEIEFWRKKSKEQLKEYPGLSEYLNSKAKK